MFFFFPGSLNIFFRALASSTLPTAYTFKSPFSSTGHSVSSTIINQANNVPFMKLFSVRHISSPNSLLFKIEYILRVVAYDDNIWRIRVTEKQPLRERFDVSSYTIAPYVFESRRSDIF